jgi:hypothetical protein
MTVAVNACADARSQHERSLIMTENALHINQPRRKSRASAVKLKAQA